MAIGQFGAVARHVSRLFGSGTLNGLDEPALLHRFITRRDPAALEALVARHGPMVLGVCRRVLKRPHDVEDAFQATFLVLAKRAGSIRDPNLLGPWLYGVAHRVAVRARANAAKRGSREQGGAEDLAMTPAADDSSFDRDDLRKVLDDELARLPERFRRPVVLCYLEGLTHDQAAAHLRCPVGTVRSRLSTARSRLREGLSRRGVTVPAGAMAAALTAEGATAAVPAVLLEKTITAATAFAASGVGAATVGAVSAGAASLAEGVATTMMISKLKATGAALIAGALMLGAGGAAAIQIGRGGEGAESSKTQEGAAGTKPVTPEENNRKVERQFLQAELEYYEQILTAAKKRQDQLKSDQGRLLGEGQKQAAVIKTQQDVLANVIQTYEKNIKYYREELRKVDLGENPAVNKNANVPAGGEQPPTVDDPNRLPPNPEGAQNGGSIPPVAEGAAPKSAAGRGMGAMMGSMGRGAGAGGRGGMMGGGFGGGGPGGMMGEAGEGEGMGGMGAGSGGMMGGIGRGNRLDPLGSQPVSLSSIGDYVLVQDHERHKLIASNPETGKSASYTLPEGTKAVPIVGAGVLAFMFEGAGLKELVAFSEASGKWVTTPLKEPTDASFSPSVGHNMIVYQAGRYVYAFSMATESWDTLEVEEGGKPMPMVGQDRAVVSLGDHTHIYDASRGKWKTYDGGTLVDHKGHTYIYNAKTDKWTDLGEGSMVGGMGAGGFR